MPRSAGIRHSGLVEPRRVVRSRSKGMEVVGLRTAQEIEICAELERVPPLHPRDVVHDVVNRDPEVVIVCDG